MIEGQWGCMTERCGGVLVWCWTGGREGAKERVCVEEKGREGSGEAARVFVWLYESPAQFCLLMGLGHSSAPAQ